MYKISNELKSKFTIISIAVLLVTSCTSIRLLSDYDEITDKKVTELQEKFAQYFTKLDRIIGTDEAKYDNYVQFFDGVKADISTIRVRANAIDKNEIVIKQLDLLDKNISDLESLHKIGFKKTAEIIPLKNAFDSSFIAIIKFQMGLKRGK
jgi:hypothetical protein